MQNKRVLVFGTFDFLHAGHQKFLKDAREFGDELFVVIARDENVAKIKGELPHFNEKVRKQNLEELKIAHKVLLGNKKNKLAVINKIKPAIIAFGFDQQAPEEEIAKKFPEIKTIRLFPHFPQKFKSSIIRKKLNK